MRIERRRRKKELLRLACMNVNRMVEDVKRREVVETFKRERLDVLV